MENPLNVKPGDIITIASKGYQVQQDSLLIGFPYYEDGGDGGVLKLQEVGSTRFYALKLFLPEKQSVRHVEHAKNLEALKIHEISGLSTARRLVLEPSTHSDVISNHKAMKYAVLMPWVNGYTWREVLFNAKNNNDISPTKKDSFTVAHRLATTLATLEAKGIAHCDICSNNVIVNYDNLHVELIDIDDMFGPGFTRAKGFRGGQKGYTHKTVAFSLNGYQWCREADRFSGAVLIAEILGWYNADFRALSAEESFFPRNDDLHQDSERLELLLSVLREQGTSKLTRLFLLAWRSETLKNCPKLSTWKDALEEIADQNGVALFNTATPLSESPIKRYRRVTFDTANEEKGTHESPKIKISKKQVDLPKPKPQPTSTTASSPKRRATPPPPPTRPPANDPSPAAVIFTLIIIAVVIYILITAMGYLAAG